MDMLFLICVVIGVLITRHIFHSSKDVWQYYPKIIVKILEWYVDIVTITVCVWVGFVILQILGVF